MDRSLLGFSGLNELFNIHPLFVHFPIALIPTAFLFFFVGTVLKHRALTVGGRACLYVALVGTLLAVYTGLHAMETFPHNETIHHMAQTHKLIALAVLGMLAVLCVWSFWQADQQPRAVWAFLLLLAMTTLAVLQTADIGARMVFVQGAAVKPAVSVVVPPDEMKEFQEHHHAD